MKKITFILLVMAMFVLNGCTAYNPKDNCKRDRLGGMGEYTLYISEDVSDDK